VVISSPPPIPPTVLGRQFDETEPHGTYGNYKDAPVAQSRIGHKARRFSTLQALGCPAERTMDRETLRQHLEWSAAQVA
jgi:hypothetical protein